MNSSETLPAASRQLMTELQSVGLRLADPGAGVASRRGGAGPSDHKAVTVDGVTIMVPVHTNTAWHSPFVAAPADASGTSALLRGTIPIANISFPKAPRFYGMQTLDGVPYSHIATLHGADVLATTVLQTCIRYESRRKTLQVLRDRPVARGGPDDCAQDARTARRGGARGGAARRRQAHGADNRHAARPAIAAPRILGESAFAIKAAVDLPIQAQCEPPDDYRWFARMKATRASTRSGMHLEAVTPALRERIMPGKAERAAIALHGRVQGSGGRVRTRPGEHLYPRGPGRQRRGDSRRLRANWSNWASTRSWCPSCRSAARRSKTIRRRRRNS